MPITGFHSLHLECSSRRYKRRPRDEIRLDQDVLEFFKASGKGYETRINAVLRHSMDERRKAGRPA